LSSSLPDDPAPAPAPVPAPASAPAPAALPGPAPAPRRPALSGALAALVLAVPLSMCLGLPVSLLAFGIATDFHGDLRDLADPESLVGTLSPVAYVTLLVLPGQAVLLLLSLGAALLSREPFLRRLGLVRPRVSLALLPFFVLVALLAGWAGGILAGRVFGEESAHLQELERVILEPQGLAMLYVLLCLSITPGVTEELLYRGYVQQRLQRRWRAPLAIAVPALFFALAHVDPMHVVGVLPVGLWLGFVAWGSGSVIPSILCHASYNAGMMLLARSVGEAGTADVAELPPAGGAVIFAVLSVCLLALCVSVPALLRAGLRRP